MTDSPIHADIPDLATTTSGWFQAAPTEPSVPPISAPTVHPMGAALSAATANWPTTHETLATGRATEAGALSSANSGTAVTIGAAEQTNTQNINGIEV